MELKKGQKVRVINDDNSSFEIGEIVEFYKQSYDGYYIFTNGKSYQCLQRSQFELIEEKPTHYDNENGSIYKFCDDQKLNSYEFDIIKRVVRCRKKGEFLSDLEKTKNLIDLYIKEHEIKNN